MTMVEQELPATSRISWDGKFKYLGYKGREFDPYAPEFRRVIVPAFQRSFGATYTDALREATYNLDSAGTLVLAVEIATSQIAGYSIHKNLRPPSIPYMRVMYNILRQVWPEYENQEVATNMLRHAHNINDAPDLLIGRTPNPAIARSYEKSGLLHEDEGREDNKVMLYPLYDTYDQSEVLQSVLDYVAPMGFVDPQLRSRPHPVNRTTGVVEGVYKQSEANTYQEEKASARVKEIYKKMKVLGMKPEKGDAIVLIGVKKGRTRFFQ